MRIKKYAFINFTGMRENWGCQATSWELLKFVNSIFDDPLPDISLVPLLPRAAIDRKIDAQYGRAMERAMLSVCAGEDISGANLAFLEKICTHRFGPYAEAVRDSDLVVFQSEGTMSGTDFLRGLRLLLLPFVAKHAWGKPVFCINQTIFSCSPDFSAVLAAVYNSFDFVAVRENISLDAALRIGVTNVAWIPDTAFLARPVPSARLPDIGPGCFLVSGTAYYHPDAYRQIFESADRIARHTRLKPVFLASTHADRALHALAQARWADIDYDIVPSTLSYNAAAAAIRRCRFLLSGRYHMNVLAVAMAVPVIQLRGNTYKNEGLSAMLGGLCPVRDPADHEAALQDALAILETEAELRSGLTRQRDAILGALRIAREELRSAMQSGRSPDLAAFPQAIGNAIDSAEHMEPYRTATIRQAEAFEYPETGNRGLGKPHTLEDMLARLMMSYADGDAETFASIRQLARSYPGLL